MAQLSDQCPTCKWLESEAEILRCKAFPEGIVFEILTGEFVHEQVHPQQTGDAVWEQKD